MIYLAPLQGFTDFVYRNAFEKVFHSVDAYFIPYITLKGTEVLQKYQKEVIPENNQHGKSVPQILAKDEEELVSLCSYLNNLGYQEINLNLGCPYPMVTNRGKGSKLLTGPEKLEQMLHAFFDNFSMKLSVKMRAGFESAAEIEKIIPVLNRFPLKNVIIHPRVASQLYKGEVHEAAFQFALENLKQTPVYNGDIFSMNDYLKRSDQFPEVNSWMLGRGVLKDVFLPDKIKGTQHSELEQRQLLLNFHQTVFEEYIRQADNSGNVLNKMQQFWSYFSHHFERQTKVLKLIKKLKDISFLEAGVKYLIINEELKRQD